MLLALLSLFTALTISGVAIYYSVIGLTAIFAAAAIPIMIMGVALEVAKLVATVWLHRNWKSSPGLIKTYLCIAVVVLMLITSMGIFGFLSKAHNDQNLVSGDVQSKIAVYDEKIKTEKENIEANRKALKQMDEGVDQVLGRSKDEKGADKAVALRKSQQKERVRLQNEILQSQKSIAELNDARAPIAAEVRKVEAEVGPIKYIAAFFYGSTDTTILEKAVTWVIMIIIFVFDPLAVVLLLASQYSFKEYFHNKKGSKMKEFFEHVEEPVSEVKAPEVPLAEPPVNLEEVKEKLEKFNEALSETKKEEPLAFGKMNTTIKGFDVPKVDITHNAKGIVPINLDTEKFNVVVVPSVHVTNTDNPVDFPKEDLLIPEGIGLEQWNKMIEEAEAALQKEKPPAEIVWTDEIQKWKEENPEGDIFEEQRKFDQGLITHLPWDTSAKYQLLPELIEHSYVQNEEQKQSGLWSMSQQDYQAKVREASTRELVKWLEEGNIKIEDLTDDEAKEVEEYLNKEKNDRQDNTDKSA